MQLSLRPSAMYTNIQIFVAGLLSVHCVLTFSTKCLLKDDFEKCIREKKESDGMKRFFLNSQSATCNDGSPAGYYVRRNPSSSQWIIYLEGGWFCHDKTSCSYRMGMVSVTSSKFLPEKKIGTGLLSLDQHENPEFWQANHVYIPYCSSDFWIGNTIHRSKRGSKIAFHGSRIVMSVVKELLAAGLKDASKLILAGSSAGGIGVLQNIDRIASMMALQAGKVEVRGIVDSAWFLDAAKKDDCKSNSINDCSPDIMFKEAVKFWNANVHTSCEQKFRDEKHKCLFASNTMPFVKTPVFIFQWLQDTVQMLADNTELKTQPALMFSSKYHSYVKRLNRRVKNSLKSVARKHGIFAPSCVSHTGLATTGSLKGISLKGKTFHDALRCWLTEKRISKCRRRVVDDCSEMSCHDSCPIIYHPLTGQEIRRPSDQTIPRDDAKFYLELLSRVFSWDDTKTEKIGKRSK